MFHIICRTLWLDQEVTEEKVSIIKPDRAISTFKRRIDAEEAKNYLTRISKRSILSSDVTSIEFVVTPGNGIQKDEQND